MSHASDHPLACIVARCGDDAHVAPASGSVCRVHSSREARQTALGKGLQGLAMVVAGWFLLSKISIAPQLTVQVVLLGSLLVAGGCAFAVAAAAAMTSHMTVDRLGLHGRLGHTAFEIQWDDVARWRVSDHDDRLPAIACAEIWIRGEEGSQSLPGGFLDREARRRLREGCRSYAADREQG